MFFSFWLLYFDWFTTEQRVCLPWSWLWEVRSLPAKDAGRIPTSYCNAAPESARWGHSAVWRTVYPSDIRLQPLHMFYERCHQHVSVNSTCSNRSLTSTTSPQTSRSTPWHRFQKASPSFRWTGFQTASRASIGWTMFGVFVTIGRSTKDPKTETMSLRWTQKNLFVKSVLQHIHLKHVDGKTNQTKSNQKTKRRGSR